jgi:guanylate kinase
LQQASNDNNASPLLVVISGPSGVGKDAALAELKLLDRPWRFVVTATTRPKREGERDGTDYIFLDTPSFLQLREQNELLESAQVFGRWYGVPRSQVRDALGANQDVFLKIDVQGAATVREIAPEAVFIFLAPGHPEDLRERLERRMTDGPDDIELRLRTAKHELAQMADFDYVVLNRTGELCRAVADIDAIIKAEKCRVRPRKVPQI